MKSILAVIALLSSTIAFSAPRVGSEANYKLTISDGTSTDVSEIKMTILEMDPATNLLRVQETTTTAGETQTDTSDENLQFFLETLKLSSNCNLNEAKRVFALDSMSDSVIAAKTEQISSIFGQIKTCRITTTDDTGNQADAWYSDKGFGFVKVKITGFPNIDLEITSYKE